MSYIESLKSRYDQAMGKVKTNPGEALKLVLNEMPVREKKVVPKDLKDEDAKAKLFTEAKDVAAKNVIDTVVAIEKGKLKAAIAGLNDEERDTLMKFVYRGFSEPEREKEDMTLLNIHDEICKVSNLGPVIRSIHTRLEV